MEDCAFYQIHHQERPQSEELNPTRQHRPTRYVDMPYCEHKHSPLPLRQVKGLVLVSTALECKGMFEKCTIPKHKFVDRITE